MESTAELKVDVAESCCSCVICASYTGRLGSRVENFEILRVRKEISSNMLITLFFGRCFSEIYQDDSTH